MGGWTHRSLLAVFGREHACPGPLTFLGTTLVVLADGRVERQFVARCGACDDLLWSVIGVGVLSMPASRSCWPRPRRARP